MSDFDTSDVDADPELDELLARAEDGDATAMVRLGTICVEENLTAKAREWYNRAREAGEPTAYHGLASISQAFGQNAEATELYEQGIAAGDDECYLPAGQLMLLVGRSEDAIDLLQRGFASGVSLCGTTLANHYLRAGKRDEAESWFLRAARHNEPAAAHVVAQIAQARAPVEHAIELHTFAADLGELDSLIAADLLADWRTDDPDELYDLADDGDVGAMVSLGRSIAQEGDLSEAVEWLSAAVEGGSIRALTALGDAFADAGDAQEAEHWYRTAAESGDRLGTYHLGRLLIDAGREEEAIALLEAGGTAESFMLLDEAWAALGDLTRAEAALDELKDLVARIEPPTLLHR
ncbi:MAG: tetratricopeptide repeat protein [Acidimicrobiia bacterium]|nr:tetratricopeptide repeat protein [Acidimicrobiia bacterium]NNL28747.1 sel1 repeat family protein [Acidimicrobiia bacterium]